MSLFKEQEVVESGAWEQLDIKEMEIGESLGFYFAETKELNSEEYGEFITCNGLKVDLEANDLNELVESAVPASFIPNTLLLNKLESGALLKGELYRIEKAWNRGDKFAGGKKAKGYGYKLFVLNVSPEAKKQLADKYAASLNPVGEESEAEAPSKPKI